MAEDVFEIVGTVVGGAYNVEAVVAEGGFAVVYRAYHGAFHAPVALKCLKVPNVTGSDRSDFLERFREEGELLFRLSMSISAVVRPLHVDAFETQRGVFVPFMAMEWLEGESLDAMIARRHDKGLPALTPRRVVRMLAPVARALDRAHKFPGPDGPISIIHRDLKPDNIVVATVNGEEVVKVLDFGIAKVKSVATQAAGRLSQDGSQGVPFTPGYAAPEQWFPKRYGQSGPWTDVWGLALTAVEAMSGKPAIDGDHAAMMGTAVDEKRRPTPRNEGAKVSDAVDQVFHRALAVDPRERYQDVGQFWDDLEEVLGLPRSANSFAGMGPQPYRDPRTEGVPPVEERIEAADNQQRVSMGLPKLSKAPLSGRLRAAPTVNEPSTALGVKPQGSPLSRPELLQRVPDLDLKPQGPNPARDVPPASALQPPRGGGDVERTLVPGEFALELPKAPEPFRGSAESLVVVLPTPPDPVQVPDLALDLPPSAAKSTREPSSEPSPSSGGLLASPASSTRGSGATAHDAASTSSRLGRSGEVDIKGAGSSLKPSGIDLAVTPAEVRRGSSSQLRAVGGTSPGGPSSSQSRADGPASRSGSHREEYAAAPGKSMAALKTPLLVIVLGLAVGGVNYANTILNERFWSAGPVPVSWIAASLVLAGAAALVVRLFWNPEE